MGNRLDLAHGALFFNPCYSNKTSTCPLFLEKPSFLPYPQEENVNGIYIYIMVYI